MPTVIDTQCHNNIIIIMYAQGQSQPIYMTVFNTNTSIICWVANSLTARHQHNIMVVDG